MNPEDDPRNYAIIGDPKLKTTWKLKLITPGQIEEAITALTEALHGNALDATPAEKRSAIPRIRKAIKAAKKDDAWKKKELARLSDASKAIAETIDDGVIDEEIEEYAITTFSGKPPEVPNAPRVNIEELTKGDDDPMFVRINFATVGKTSVNKRRYNRPFVEKLVEQINSKPIGGLRTHLKDEERATANPIPEGYWVGATLVGDEGWAKAYIPPSPYRDHVRRLKATGGELPTSIYGFGRSKMQPDGVKEMIDIDLEYLDFAKLETASLKPTSAFQITAETIEPEAEDEPDPETTPEPELDPAPDSEVTTETIEQESHTVTPEERAKLIKELTADDVPNLPDPVVTAIMAKNKEKQVLTEQISELTFERDSLKKTNDDLIAELATFKKTQFDTELWGLICETVEWDAVTDEAKQDLSDARNILLDLVSGKLGEDQDLKKAKRVIAETVEGHYKSTLEAYRDKLAGPSVVGGFKDKKKDFRDRIAEDPSVAQRWGVKA